MVMTYNAPGIYVEEVPGGARRLSSHLNIQMISGGLAFPSDDNGHECLAI